MARATAVKPDGTEIHACEDGEPAVFHGTRRLGHYGAMVMLPDRAAAAA